MSERIEADYIIETATNLEKAAATMAGEQSSGTFTKVPGETPELIERAGARVEKLTVLDTVEKPSLPGAKPGTPIRQAKVTISWPLETIGLSVPHLSIVIGGNLFELGDFSGLKVDDIRLPESFLASGPGPGFGIEGTRRLSGVYDRPLIGTIIKPSVGFTPEQTADLAEELAQAGLDFIKDDELQAASPSCPFEARVDAVMDRLHRHADRVGTLPMFAFNLTGEVDDMLRRRDYVLKAGGSCVMMTLNAVGLSGFMAVSRQSPLPIHAHRAGWGALSRHPVLGWSFPAWSKLWRLAGADHIHVNGIDNKFCESNESVIRSARSCLEPLGKTKPCITMPVFSSGQTPRQVPQTYAGLGSRDLIHAAGGGILGHPGGPSEGVAEMRSAWDAQK
ncbi:RuBisCO large subunit C-terminal-like domain-containing protein [Thioclava sp. 15-R06ZXC-3]|uniref:RuBisCO large subunit C-terminal-like domain-containing protein n=1 Tax=Thioclava arctica TaxID=3238301 RepID=A0ABV3TR05_9RHOB